MPARSPRRRRLSLLLVASLLLTVAVALPGGASHAQSISGVFESDDGNLAPDHDGAIDWNSFTDTGTAGEWNFRRIDDPKDARNRDDQFSGGTKQDTICPNITTGTFGGPDGSKVDLDRLYLASKRIGTDDFLFLAWARVRQNSQTASSHVAYEFNKGEATCANSGLKQRQSGDLLVVYDFPGGNTTPNVKISRWLMATDPGSCEVSNSSKPCWGNTQDLVRGVQFDARVNSTASVYDAHVDADLGIVEFGEASINLTTSGIFTPGVCDGFGSVTGVSRSSGSSGSAQMKDLVGPAPFVLSNCGSLTIKKVTDPTGGQGFDFTLTRPNASTTAFSLDHNGTRSFLDLPNGTYEVEEDPKAGWDLMTIACVDSEGAAVPNTKAVVDLAERTVSVAIVPNDAITCTFTNRQRHSLVVAKVTGSAPLPGAAFDLHQAVANATPPPDYLAGAKVGTFGGLDGDAGNDATLFCIDGLVPGRYVVKETAVPAGYQQALDQVVMTSSSKACADRYDGTAGTVDAIDVTVTNTPAPRTVTVTKELEDAATPLPGFGFAIYDGHDVNPAATPAPTARASGSTNAQGEVAFTSIPPGNYTLCEVSTPTPTAYWTPAVPTCRNITVVVGQDVEETFVNEPLSKVDLTFHNMTGYTTAFIDCGAPDQATSALADATKSVTLDHLPAGTYDCTVTIYNGSPPTP